MKNPNANFGRLCSVHRPIVWRILLLALLCLCFLFIVLLVVIVLIDSLSQGKGISFGAVGGVLVIVLLFLLLASFLVSELRKWLPTRKVALRIYDQGLKYKNANQIEACRWDQIRDITHRTLNIHSKHSAPVRISVIRSIVREDGEVIVLADTLDLRKITGLIGAAIKANNVSN
jgi:Family of unknown function (DUF6585)